jgi:prephenate dehydratase
MKANLQVAYLGPEGTFSHLVARKRFGTTARLLPQPSVYDVFAFVRAGPQRMGIAPIENSSGGTIYETIDGLVAEAGKVVISEELSLNVRLALLGRSGEKILALYSHFIPLQHVQPWVREHLPGVRQNRTSSTARAAEAAAAEPGAAALGTREAARRYGLQVLKFPVHSEVPNITEFIVLGQQTRPAPRSTKTSLLVTLENRPGSLFDFLQAFKQNEVNLTRLLSRPIIGQPKSYLFMVDLQGTPTATHVQRALAAARRAARSLTVLGVYPVRKMYAS